MVSGKNTKKKYIEKVLMTLIVMVVWSLTWSQISWSMKSSGPYKVLLQTKLVEVMEFQISYLNPKR